MNGFANLSLIHSFALSLFHYIGRYTVNVAPSPG